MPSSFVAHQEPIAKIFSSSYVFTVPGYQRPYSWTSEQARELFEDLSACIGDQTTEIEKLPPYFLGSIVLIKSEGDPAADVVDGQQRLTTLTILLAAIRANVNDKNASDITTFLYEQGSVILGTRDRFRLNLRERDREFFQQYVQRVDGFPKLGDLPHQLSDSRRNIRDNSLLYHNLLKEMSDQERLRLAQFILTRCYLVAVATPDIDSAYRIFSVLNTRGLDLSVTDILKSRVLGRIPEGDRDAYTKKWEDVEDDLGRESFSDLFSHIRMIYRKAKLQGTLLSEFTEHVLGQVPSASFMDEVLLPFSLIYEEITDAQYASPAKAEEVNDSLRWLNRLEHRDWIPPALVFVQRHRKSSDQIAAFFRDLERLSYALLALKAGVNERIDRFGKVIRAIEQSSDLSAEDAPLQLSRDEQARVYVALDGPLYDNFGARARSTIMLRLDSLLAGGGATYDYPTITVEHVLPQNPHPSSVWQLWFPDPQTRLELVHRLGNLVLLTRKKNSSASNFDFKQKKQVYFLKDGVSPFPLTTQVIQHEDWTPETIGTRQRELLAVFERHWRLQNRVIPPEGLATISAPQLDSTWREDVREALHALGGTASLTAIYDAVEALRRTAGRTVPKSLDAVVRRTLEENSSDSEGYKRRADLFTMPNGKGAGVWSLR